MEDKEKRVGKVRVGREGIKHGGWDCECREKKIGKVGGEMSKERRVENRRRSSEKHENKKGDQRDRERGK